MVKVFSRIGLDRVGYDVYALMDEARGLLSLKASILRALVGGDPQFERNSIMMNQIMAKNSAAPNQSKLDPSYVELSIMFSADFMWDLTS